MCFKSSSSVFKSNKTDFMLYYTFSNFNLNKISHDLHAQYYSQRKGGNKPFDPSSMLRLILVFQLYFPDKRFFKKQDIHNIPDSYLRLCGFNLDDLPVHSTFYNFLNRIPITLIQLYINKFRVLFMKMQFRFFTCKFTKKYGKFIVFAVDSKPIEVEGNVPKGTIHTCNKRFNGKLGIKVHSISIIYPFYFPILFKFTPGHYSDSTIFKQIFPLLEPLLQELNLQGILTFFTADAGYDGIENITLITDQDIIPCITKNQRNSKKSKFDINNIYCQNDKFYCIHNEEPFHVNSHEGTRHQYKCYHCKNCPHSEKCSKRFWIRIPPNHLKNEMLLMTKLNLEIRASKMYKYIYSFRKRIETIHAIWNNKFSLENKFYLHNFKELIRFERSIESYSFKHFLYASKACVINYFY